MSSIVEKCVLLLPHLGQVLSTHSAGINPPDTGKTSPQSRQRTILTSIRLIVYALILFNKFSYKGIM